MDLATYAVFSPACVALNMAPGPNKLLSISYALRYGFVMACRGGLGRSDVSRSPHCVMGMQARRMSGRPKDRLM